MLKKYNIALLPKRKNEKIIELSEQFDLNFYDYKLGKKSYAHLTIIQFYADNFQVEKKWLALCEQYKMHEIELIFQFFSIFTLDSQVFWLSILPDKIKILYEIHRSVCSILKLSENKLYDPHVTLFSTKDRRLNLILESFPSFLVSDYFVLSIGECDEAGQFTKLIAQQFT